MTRTTPQGPRTRRPGPAGNGGWPGASLLLCAALAACAEEPPAVDCVTRYDCAQGVCSGGRCVAAPDAGEEPGGDAGQGPADGGHLADGGSGGSDGGAPPACLPDHDGRLTGSDVPMRAGLEAVFRVAQNADWNTAGTTGADGRRSWDLARALDGDRPVNVRTLPLEGKWFADRFPGATYAARLTQSSDLLGVFEATPDALLLRGVASPEDGYSRTLVEHDPPVTVLAFPLARDAAWSTVSTVSGVVDGFVQAATERYESVVDAVGDLDTPYGRFPVLRVRTWMKRSSMGWPVAETRTHLFVAECFGTVASVVSRDGEDEDEFTRAAEIRRLAP